MQFCLELKCQLLFRMQLCKCHVYQLDNECEIICGVIHKIVLVGEVGVGGVFFKGFKVFWLFFPQFFRNGSTTTLYHGKVGEFV